MQLPGVPMKYLSEGASSHHPPQQPPFAPSSLSSLPSFNLHPATPVGTPQNNRVAMIVDDVFGPAHHADTPTRGNGARFAGREMPPAFPESPIRPHAEWH